jgi:hypothetical protein
MAIPERDTHLIEYARRQGLPWYYAEEGGAPEKTRLTLHHGCVTATFEQGCLVELRADADHELFDVLFENLTRLFALSATSASQVHGEARNMNPRDKA